MTYHSTENTLDKSLSKNAKAIQSHMLSFVNKEVKTLRKTGNPMNIDVAVSKLQECIDKRDSSETIKVLKQSRRVFDRTKFHL